MSDATWAQQGATFEFYATCAAGFEQLLAGELTSFAIASPRPLKGQVAFTATLKQAYTACLWSRIASRIVLVLAHGEAQDSDALYATLANLPWEQHLAPTTTFAIDPHGTNDELRNTQFVALRAKDAICDRMQDKLGMRPNVDTKNPQLRIAVRLRAARVTCGIDLTGTPLFYRGVAQRMSDGLGVVRADYAAALLAAGSWYSYCRKDNPVLVALFSGAGTIACEAMTAALDIAPGLSRVHWGFEGWLGHDATAWSNVFKDAQDRAEAGRAKSEHVHVIALDERSGAASALRQSLRASGVPLEPVLVTDSGELADAMKRAGATAQNTLATLDLSWVSESETQEITALTTLSAAFGAFENTLPVATLCKDTTFARVFDLEPRTSIGVKIGRDDAVMCLCDVSAQAAAKRLTVTLKTGEIVPVLVSASDQFAARLAKVAKLRAKWARNEDITCYRVYDADLPDYAVAIDLYQASEASPARDKNAKWLVIQEYEAPKSVDAQLAHSRLLDVMALAPVILKVDPKDVFVRVRRHAKGGSQYADGGKAQGDDAAHKRAARTHSNAQAKAPRLPFGSHLIDEGGLAFEVNFDDRLDTGIFLDHRDVRAEVREMAKKTKGSKRFLNLFAYTGTATCYAADGGAKYTTTVDLSKTYLEWARRNMAYNGFEGPEHEFVQADVVRWVSLQRRTPNRWDLVFCDPPTFSNSKRMSKATFDVQRDHAELLIGISRLLTANGVCLFSCNLRGFKPDTEKLAKAGVQIEDVTQGSIPEDFSRNAKIHHCYLVRRTPREIA